MAPGKTQAPICREPAKVRERGEELPESHRPGACPGTGPGSGRHRSRRGTHGTPRQTAGSGRRRMDSGDQGWGAAVVIDGRGATGAAGFTASSASHSVQRRAVAGAAGRWGYSVSGSRRSAGCAAGLQRPGRGSGLDGEGMERRPGPGACGGNGCPIGTHGTGCRGVLHGVGALNSRKSTTYSTRLGRRIIVRRTGPWGHSFQRVFLAFQAIAPDRSRGAVPHRG